MALVARSGKSPEQIAKELDLTPTAVRAWVRLSQEREARRNEPPHGEDERAELLRLRKENARLQMERDFLKKAAAFFAKESK